ncbi:hypothetical protein VY86_13490 [Photorhabdus thracensis]|uniref:Uncharacterized protein n=1 Tax=Photorhabdus thracensis TaxID=230089 RepID=A0A0F7LNS7_9GAMM|nr:hypothetical protein [Photorhabdus thracensis]AKH64190.1 hypothetical protein VY86_13490 [Photorhabdus thracensis]
MSLNTFCIGLSGGGGTSTVLSSVTTVAEGGAHPQDKYGCSISQLQFLGANYSNQHRVDM